ncbi:MAG TPA: hypothetical protein PKZ08_13490 [Vicinamibacterales bacterium]|nr:hypothetical protein [Vicinamibacterales bacterium]
MASGSTTSRHIRISNDLLDRAEAYRADAERRTGIKIGLRDAVEALIRASLESAEGKASEASAA